jgi:predicted transcriptional regulator YdeE
MPAYHVARSIIINSPVEKVRDSLIDYRQWPKWSPWLIMEEETQLHYTTNQSQIGAGYDWDGELTGKGSMKLTEINQNNLVMHLQFVKPFKSTADVSFELEEARKNVTKVTWNMNSKLPFFLFWMVNKMKIYIGMDYERGLRMLKEYLETGNVASKVKVEGISRIERQPYIGIKSQCAINDIGKVMPEDYKQLFLFMQENIKGDKDLKNTIVPFSIYQSFDMRAGQTSFISAIPVDDEMNLSAPFINGVLDAGEYIKVVHTGKYEHLGNAWSTAMAHSRMKKIRTKKTPIGIEFYLNDPTTTPQDHLFTEVALPLR